MPHHHLRSLRPGVGLAGMTSMTGLGGLAALLLLSAAAHATTAAVVTPEELGSLRYRIEGEREPLRMRDGLWQGRPAAPGSATVPNARVHTELTARGDLNRDGQEDTVVLLEHDPGGSGRFVHLAVVSRREGRAVMLASRLVGDRVQVRSLKVEGGQILLEVVRAGPGDPSCCPGELATLTWTLQRRGLVPGPERGTPHRLTPSALEGVNWTLTHWAAGEPASLDRPIQWRMQAGRASGFAGCNRFQASAAAAPPDSAGALQFSPPAVTRMACEPEAMQAEARFLAALSSVTAFGYRFGRLVLQGTGSTAATSLLFEPR
ncbi:MAG: hypothetical protein RI988_4004 [Pseudomonadota bacterium]|jgi:heat shock protein HslJ